MTAVIVHGELGADRIRALEDAGFSILRDGATTGSTDDGVMVVARFDAHGFQGTGPRAGAHPDQPLVAWVDTADQTDDALRAGALDVVVGSPSKADLRIQLARVQRFTDRFQRRMDEHERRAQHAMDELSSTRDLFERLIDATPNPVMATDPKGRVLVFNRVAEVALGYSATYAKEHMHVTDVYASPADARRVLAEIRGATHRMCHGLEVRLRARSGEHIPVLLSAGEVVGSGGEPIATIGVFQDMREQMSLRNRLQATTDQLIATEKRAATIELAGAAAHELNQPLTAVMGILELLELRNDLDEDARKKLQRASSQLARMAEIVRALARTSRPRTTGYVGGQRILELKPDDPE